MKSILGYHAADFSSTDKNEHFGNYWSCRNDSMFALLTAAEPAKGFSSLKR
jgi:hypothetical protein